MSLFMNHRFTRLATLFVLFITLLLLLLGINANLVAAQSRVPTGQACVKVEFNHTNAINETIEISVQANPNDASAGAAGSIAAGATGTTQHFTETAVTADSSTTSGNTGVYCTNTVVYEATYTMTVKSPDTLRVKDGSVTTNFFGGALAPLIDGNMVEGDANNDNAVNFGDLIVFSPTFGKSSTDGGYNAGADFNEDNAVNFGDLILFSPNFGQSGVRKAEPATKTSDLERAMMTTDAGLYIVPVTTTVAAGQSSVLFTVMMTNTIDIASIQLDIDVDNALLNPMLGNFNGALGFSSACTNCVGEVSRSLASFSGGLLASGSPHAIAEITVDIPGTCVGPYTISFVGGALGNFDSGTQLGDAGFAQLIPPTTSSTVTCATATAVSLSSASTTTNTTLSLLTLAVGLMSSLSFAAYCRQQ